MGSNHNNQIRLTRFQNIILVCFSLIYGYVLQSLPLLDFLDRQNYLNYAEHSFSLLVRYAASGALTVLVNEPLWLLINAGLAQFFDPEIVLRIVIFCGASLLSYTLIRVDFRNSIWLMLFLLMPYMLKNHITHLRQGLAMAVFYAGYFSRGSRSRWLLMTASPFIHASFFLVMPIVILPAILQRVRFAMDIRMLLLVGFAFTISLFLGVFASMLGARQSNDYNFEMATISGLGFFFWVIIGALFVSNGRKWLAKNQEAVSVLVFYLVSYFVVEVASRIFESGLPLVLLAGLALGGGKRLVFIGAFLSFSIIQWGLRLSSEMPF